MSSRDRDSAIALSKAKAIIVDDSETEDDEVLPSIQTGPTVGASTSRAVLDSARKPRASVIVVDDSEMEDAEERKPAKSGSLPRTSAGEASGFVSTVSGSSLSHPKDKEQKVIPSIQSGPLGSLPDRAQMEAERLARRKHALEEQGTSGDPKRQRIASTTVSSTPQTPLASRMFYDGAFFPTATLHATPRADGREAIGFQDILGPASSPDLKLVIISSYGCSPEWLEPHFHPAVPVILVVGSGTEESGPSMTILLDNWVQTCPKLGTGGCMHMKYMVLFYKSGRLRVVISTANLISIDWGHLENAVFIQDVYLNSSSSTTGTKLSAENPTQSTSGTKAEEGFAKILENVLKATNVGPALEHFKQTKSDLPINSIDDLSKLWDWSNVTAQLVPSIAGKSEGWERIMKNGHPRLLRAIKSLGLATSGTRNLIVECQGSSIGMYTTQWFNQFYLSASGHASALKAHMDISESKRKKLAYPPAVKVVFPTLATVKSTAEHGARSLFCTRKKWDGTPFPRSAFYDSKSRAGRVLMHTKMIIGALSQNTEAMQEKSSSAVGWMYVGSHNFTSPAWGNLSGSASAPVLNVNNFELGVVVPLATLEDMNEASAWERPPRKYTKTDLPWIKDEHGKDH
ncbi:tyrosyl-DNA phosphodiesterase-domain-containing protein [Mycena latifolia]|nr:tyrosyl-DNA phosphodiesterase-domain-containing protein [Mycena latifolia]